MQQAVLIAVIHIILFEHLDCEQILPRKHCVKNHISTHMSTGKWMRVPVLKLIFGDYLCHYLPKYLLYIIFWCLLFILWRFLLIISIWGVAKGIYILVQACLSTGHGVWLLGTFSKLQKGSLSMLIYAGIEGEWHTRWMSIFPTYIPSLVQINWKIQEIIAKNSDLCPSTGQLPLDPQTLKVDIQIIFLSISIETSKEVWTQLVSTSNKRSSSGEMKKDQKRVVIYREMDLTLVFDQRWTVKANLHTFVGGDWSVISVMCGVWKAVAIKPDTCECVTIPIHTSIRVRW